MIPTWRKNDTTMEQSSSKHEDNGENKQSKQTVDKHHTANEQTAIKRQQASQTSQACPKTQAHRDKHKSQLSTKASASNGFPLTLLVLGLPPQVLRSTSGVSRFFQLLGIVLLNKTHDLCDICISFIIYVSIYLYVCFFKMYVSLLKAALSFNPHYLL